MKYLEKLSKKIGFTETETNIILFIVLACLAGIAVNLVKSIKNEKAFLEYDYIKEDSLFNAASGDPGIKDSDVTHVEKKIASQSELLDFTKGKLAGSRTKIISSPQIPVNINAASGPELARLPGLGDRTAAAIIDYRTKYGKIKTLDELMNIKGIGKEKLEKIRNMIIVE